MPKNTEDPSHAWSVNQVGDAVCFNKLRSRRWRCFGFVFLFSLTLTSVRSQQVLSLYPGDPGAIPNAIAGPDGERTAHWGPVGPVTVKVSRPTLTVFLPPAKKANGLGIIVCPGGGYEGVAVCYEGTRVATQLNQMGIAAFVLKYRLPDSTTMRDQTIGPLQDVQQALKVVRQRAVKYRINPQHLGLMGFSAGGHLAASAGTHFAQTFIENSTHLSLRPDFMVLVYPVISFTDEIGHRGSRVRLLGPSATAAQIRCFSNEFQVTPQTPPTFLLHAGDDTLVAVANSIRFYEALRANQVNAELHIYAKGNHGFINNWPADNWLERCRTWFARNGWLSNSPNSGR